jgi:dihydropteroate synthase
MLARTLEVLEVVRVIDHPGVVGVLNCGSFADGDRHELRGQLAQRAHEMERHGYEIISMNIGQIARNLEEEQSWAGRGEGSDPIQELPRQHL